MNCQVCNQREARIQVTELEVLPGQADDVPVPEQVATFRSLCTECATAGQVPVAVVKKAPLDIWKLLQQTAEKHRRETHVECPDCGMTLGEFRAKGRLGCPRDYEIFREHLDPLLKRIHNADTHAGRLPGAGVPDEAPPSVEVRPSKTAGHPAVKSLALQPAEDPAEAARKRLRTELEAAVAAEDYERAAELRDELRTLDGGEA